MEERWFSSERIFSWPGVTGIALALMGLVLLAGGLWLIGLGNLGQAYAWLLACLPYPARVAEIMLQDFDTLADSNDSTSNGTSHRPWSRLRACAS